MTAISTTYFGLAGFPPPTVLFRSSQISFQIVAEYRWARAA